MKGVDTITPKHKLAVIDGETLMDTRLEPIKYCVDTLIPQGLTILGGAPKIGKSWWVLDLCVRIAKGEPVWNMPTTKGTVLYLCLEDTYRRIQDRLNHITDDVSDKVFFAINAHTVSDGLCDEIRSFVNEHSDTVFIAIDTFQIVRDNGKEFSYANDYREVRILKSLADDLGITLLVVHHLNKSESGDPVEKLSGSTGIGGAVDTIFVLDKTNRGENRASLICTGRDIEYRKLELKFSESDYVWELVSDSREHPEMLLPSEMEQLVSLMREQQYFKGGNSDFVEWFNAQTNLSVSVKGFKQILNRWRYRLEELGVHYTSSRSNGMRLLEIKYVAPPSCDESDVSDV